LGATETVEWSYSENLEQELVALRKEGFTIGAIEQTEQTTLLQEVAAFDIKPYALIFGNEVNGVRQELVDLSDCVIEIPQFGTKHSFNVSVCAGIVLWEFCKKFID
jgi:tRNA G18 (ribose-2'-O)-methylase SpoU